MFNLTMQEWIEIAGRNSLALVALVAIGWFVYKKLWPIIEKRLADADQREQEHLRMWREQGERFTEALRLEREDNARRFEDQGKIFMESLRTQQVFATETHKESMKSQTKIAEKLETLDRHIRNGNGK